MSCADVCLSMDHDGNKFQSSQLRKARKPHKCCECGETIPAGATYEYYSACSCDGDFFDAKTCVICLDIRNALVCGMWIFEMLWESIEEEVFPAWLASSPIDCLAKVETLAARNVLRQRFAAWKHDRGYDDE